MTTASVSNSEPPKSNSSKADLATEKDVKPVGPAALEEDDEFEDFPVENWSPEETEGASKNLNLWEESWDDDDASEDFSAQLKEELKKVQANIKS